MRSLLPAPSPKPPASVLCETKRRREENQNLRNCQTRSPEDARTRCQSGGTPRAPCPRAEDSQDGRGGLLLRGPGVWSHKDMISDFGESCFHKSRGTSQTAATEGRPGGGAVEKGCKPRGLTG